jgi:hypothetical protein
LPLLGVSTQGLKMGGDAAGSVIVATPGSDLDRSKFVIVDPVIDVSIAGQPCFHIMRGGNLTICRGFMLAAPADQ